MTVPDRSVVAMSGPGRNRVTMAVPVRSALAITCSGRNGATIHRYDDICHLIY